MRAPIQEHHPLFPFFEWLQNGIKEESAFGDLARDLVQDLRDHETRQDLAGFPDSFDALEGHLDRMNASANCREAFTDAKEAFALSLAA